MIRFLMSCAVLFIFSSLAMAGDLRKKETPEKIHFKMGAMHLEFLHKKHIQNLNNECFHCHKTEFAKIDNWGEKTAHTICIPCHDMNDKGPVECNQCHK